MGEGWKVIRNTGTHGHVDSTACPGRMVCDKRKKQAAVEELTLEMHERGHVVNAVAL